MTEDQAKYAALETLIETGLQKFSDLVFLEMAHSRWNIYRRWQVRRQQHQVWLITQAFMERRAQVA